jgi:hypothetical protein
MTASAATVTLFKEGQLAHYKVASFKTAMAATATDGVEVYLGWSGVDNCHISLYSATAADIGFSWQYVQSTGILTLYATTTAGDAADVLVTVLGQD